MIDAHRAGANRLVSNIATTGIVENRSRPSIFERSDEQATRGQEWESLRSDKKDANDPLADLPFWLEEFTDNLEDTEVPALAHSSQDADSEYPTKVVSKSRSHCIYTHFPKDRNCDVLLRTNMTRASCRRRAGQALLRAEKFGDLMTADHKVLNEGCESRDNHRWLVVVQDLATQWTQSFPCKTKSSHERKEAWLLLFVLPIPR